jgi:hypothetical protein
MKNCSVIPAKATEPVLKKLADMFCQLVAPKPIAIKFLSALIAGESLDEDQRRIGFLGTVF